VCYQSNAATHASHAASGVARGRATLRAALSRGVEFWGLTRGGTYRQLDKKKVKIRQRVKNEKVSRKGYKERKWKRRHQNFSPGRHFVSLRHCIQHVSIVYNLFENCCFFHNWCVVRYPGDVLKQNCHLHF